MFCFQCQETAQGVGCTVKGVCGKTSDVAGLQDLLVYLLKGLSKMSLELRSSGNNFHDVDRFITRSLFMTITNANFDKSRFVAQLNDLFIIRTKLKEVIAQQAGNNKHILLSDDVLWEANNVEDMEIKAQEIGVLNCKDDDIRSLRELLIYGLKGMAAYCEHAANLGFEKDDIYYFIQKALSDSTKELTVDEYVQLVLECGNYGVKTMALLDEANSTHYGNPEITKVNIGVRNNPGILISGHDLYDLEELLKQTEDKGVDVYTHSEMLPAHYYPVFKKYKHFVGNYGNAWWKQNEEFELFNGVILFTTNCIVPPKSTSTYMDRVYTTGAAGYHGFKHIADAKVKDFSALISHAQKCKPPIAIEEGEIIGGFAHKQVLDLADKIVDAVKLGKINKFVVMAGCDGRMKKREYYTDFAKQLPKDCVILTAGCAKYRYNKLQLGDINGIPRVLDAGQCNDSYSLAVIALKLKEAFELDDINKLPIIYNIAWYEQKAVIVLLALLALGVKNIHLGPSLPAFLSPNVAKVLVDNFGLAAIDNVQNDIKLFFEK